MSDRDSKFPMEPADEFPKGWMKNRIPRAGSNGKKKDDVYWYSPKLKFKFRSKPEVRRFLESLKGAGGDEAKAILKC